MKELIIVSPTARLAYFSWTSGAFEGQPSIKDAVDFFLREKARTNNKPGGKK